MSSNKGSSRAKGENIYEVRVKKIKQPRRCNAYWKCMNSQVVKVFQNHENDFEFSSMKLALCKSDFAQNKLKRYWK